MPMPDNTMPSFDSMTKVIYSTREWLTYYKNTWSRNVTARLIDVQTDKVRKTEDAEQMVSDEATGQQIPVKIRYEMRKLAVQEALDILNAAEALLALNDDELAAKTSAEALKVDADMMPTPAKAGDVCKLADGKEGVLGDMNGELVCVEKPAEETKLEDNQVKPEEEQAKPAEESKPEGEQATA